MRHDAPRMDLLARRALDRMLHALEIPRPDERSMYVLTLIGDVSSNALYYTALLLRPGAHVLRRALIGGAVAGATALALPPRLGLGDPPREQRASTRVMTVAWYTLGALAAAMTSRLLARTAARPRAGPCGPRDRITTPTTRWRSTIATAPTGSPRSIPMSTLPKELPRCVGTMACAARRSRAHFVE